MAGEDDGVALAWQRELDADELDPVVVEQQPGRLVGALHAVVRHEHDRQRVEAAGARERLLQLRDPGRGAQERPDQVGVPGAPVVAVAADCRGHGGVAGREGRRVVEHRGHERAGGARVGSAGHPPTLGPAVGRPSFRNTDKSG